MLTIVLFSSMLDAALLGHDDFHVRQSAEARLKAWREAAVPALVFASHSGDPEIRSRASRVLDPIARVWRPLLTGAHAFWLFYGPNEHREGRWLSRDSEDYLNGLSEPYHSELADYARHWGLLRPGEDFARQGGLMYGWVNVMRHRAWGVPLPGR